MISSTYYQPQPQPPTTWKYCPHCGQSLYHSCQPWYASLQQALYNQAQTSDGFTLKTTCSNEQKSAS